MRLKYDSGHFLHRYCAVSFVQLQRWRRLSANLRRVSLVHNVDTGFLVASSKLDFPSALKTITGVIYPGSLRFISNDSILIHLDG